MEFAGLTWFNVSSPWVHRRPMVRLWNAHNRVTRDDGHHWGFGLLQVNSRHLFYIGTAGVSVLFIGKTA